MKGIYALSVTYGTKSFNKIWNNPLVQTAHRLHKDVSSRLTGPIAEFLLSLHDAEPDFGLLGFPEAIHLSGVQWKLLNLRKLIQQNPKKHAEQRNALEQLFM